MPSVGRDAVFLHTKAVGVPFLQEKSTLIEQYWTLTTFIESCEGHWWQKLNQQRMLARQRQQLQAVATGLKTAPRLAVMEQQHKSPSSVLVKSTETPRRKDSVLYPDTVATPLTSPPTNVQKSGRKRRQARITNEGPQPLPPRKRKLGDPSNRNTVDVADDRILDGDADFLTGVRRSTRTLDKKVNYSQISSSQSPSRDPTPVQNSEPDSAFSPPRSIVSDASTTVPPASARAVIPDQIADTTRTSNHRNAGVRTPDPRHNRTTKVRKRQESITRTTVKEIEQNRSNLNVAHSAFGQTQTEWPVISDLKSMSPGMSSFHSGSLEAGSLHFRPTQEKSVSDLQQPSNARAMQHPNVESDALATPKPARLGALVKLKVPTSVLGVQDLQSGPLQQVARQEEAAVPSLTQVADTCGPSPLIVPTSEDLVVTPMPYGTTPAADIELRSHDPSITPNGALSFDPTTIDDESFHFNSASFDGDDNGISYHDDAIAEPNFVSTGMGFNNNDNSQYTQANSPLTFGTQSIPLNASVLSPLRYGDNQSWPEVSTSHAYLTDANAYSNSDIGALSEINWALDHQS
jgi:hypothetical protein